VDAPGSGQERVAGSCERGNEPSEFLDYLSDYLLLKKNCALWSYIIIRFTLHFLNTICL
jgi:hypothetical protein